MLYGKGDSQRSFPEENSWGKHGRSDFRRDYGRLLHSPSFRRLQGKTQLFPGDESDFFRNRLTHSLEVAQIAKGIALSLNKKKPFKDNPIDTDLVELAGLAHDLGHPPFGHNGERALDDCMKNYGGFEGNAQTLRLLAKIEKKGIRNLTDSSPIDLNGNDVRRGLNLTYRSLASILKYDNRIPPSRPAGSKVSKGYYDSEYELVQQIKANVGSPKYEKTKFKTVECQIMDIADDIAYSTYDLEDAMKGGFSHPLDLHSKFGGDPIIRKRIFEKVLESIPDTTEKEVSETLIKLFDLEVDSQKSPLLTALNTYETSITIATNGFYRSGFTSDLISKFMNGVHIKNTLEKNIIFTQIELMRDVRLEVETLKHLNYQLMILSPRLKVVEYRGYDLVKDIFEALTSDEGHFLLPEDYRFMFHKGRCKELKMRLVCDFIAGMTDRYAIEFYSRIKTDGASIFKPI